MIKATYKRLIIKKNFEKKWLQAKYKLRTGLNKSVFWRGNCPGCYCPAPGWPGLVKIQHTELKLSCANDPVVKNSIYGNGDLDLWLMTPKYIGFFPFHRGIMWSSLVKIQYTEIKLSCGNDHVVKNKTKGPKQDRQNLQRSPVLEGGEP